MEWTCRDCGNEVVANDVVLVATIGWTGLDGDTGRCPVCSHPGEPESINPRLAASAARHARSLRALGVSQRMVEKARVARWDDPFVQAAAERLGFAVVPCVACQGRGDPHCPNCEGAGEVWRSGIATVSRAGLLRLAMMPQARGKP